MSDRRIDVEVHSFLDLDLEVVLMARNGLADPEKWIQGHLAEKDSANAGLVTY